ncbi:MAG: carbon-nitrogen hydrolase family protein [Verrucomicrobia bacterium]|nr:carbon-nitrogen hydrolase family protein [Verrucomicrobiota bacterium]
MPSTEPRTIKIALAQIHIEGGALEANLARVEVAVADAASADADIVVLPEASDLGWAHPSAAKLAESVPGGATITRIQAMAQRNHIWLCIGLSERDSITPDHCYNAAVLIDRQGELLLHHRKIHELDFAREVYATGSRLAVVNTEELGCIGVIICADAFVPDRVISRSLGQMGARLLLSPCAWAVPADHDNHADPYGQLWLDSYTPVAKEFGMWIAGVSNVGQINAGAWEGRKCIGNSLLIAPDGTTHLQAPYGEAAAGLFLAEMRTS